MNQLDATHDPGRRSWVAAANEPGTDFPIQNLPLGVFSAPGRGARGGVAIGDRILDLALARETGLFAGAAEEAARAASGAVLNPLMALGASHWAALRHRLSELLSVAGGERSRIEPLADRLLVPMAEAELHRPAAIANYSDFFASLYHATNTGSMFRPDNPLFPNYKYVPIAYHGRASSIGPSGMPVRRPLGQRKPADAAVPSFGPSRNLDYELELGIFIGPGSSLGEPIPIARAGEHIFGFCLLNDWSARDIQAWEYQPLGPFLAKSFATTISPWIVTAAALSPFRVPAFARAATDPAPMAYLTAPEDQRAGGLDLALEVAILTPAMRAEGRPAFVLSRSNTRDLYWTVAQMVTHQASNGCNLEPGDLLGSGTVSGATVQSFGSLLELTWRGSKPIALPGGETRRFLEDGDEVVFRARAERPGFVSLGLGECRARIAPAPALAP
jgi:fumarylacetoacetase